MNRTATLLSSALFASIGTVVAENPRIEEVVVYGVLSPFSALKSDTPIMETSRSISIITEQQMIDRGALTLDDTFTYSAGVIGETYGYATRADWIKVRGLDVPQYQDSLQSLFGNYNNTRPHIYTLEQVEILKGPASVLYGQGSPGGLVNVVSKRPDEDTSHQIVTEYGNFEHAQVAVDSTGKLSSSGDWLYRFIGIYKDSDTQVDHISEKITVVAPSITWRATESTDITMLLNYTDSQTDTAAQFLPVAGTLDPAANGKHIDSSNYLGEPSYNKYDATTTSITLLASHQFSDIWSMEFTSRYTDGDADYQQAWPSYIGGDRYVYNSDGSLYKDGTVPRSFYRSESTSEQATVDVRFRADFDTGAIAHNVLLGSQYQNVSLGDAGYYAFALGFDFATRGPDTEFGDQYWINVFNPVYGNVPPEDLLNALFTQGPDTQVDDTGLYSSDHITYENWHLTVGARWDKTENKTGDISQDDDEFSGSAGVLYEFSTGFAPYVNYAESFEPVIGDNGNGQPLKPQKGEQLEAGLKYQPQSFPALMTLAWYDLDVSNLRDPLSKPGTFEQQSGVTTIKGIEFEGMAQLGDVSVELNLSHLDTETQDGWHLASVPKKQASSWISWRPQGTWNGFKTGAGIRYVGSSWGGIDQIKTPSYTLGDLMIGWQADQWDVALNVRNLTDKDYYATCLTRGGCFPGEQRTIVGRFTYQF